MPHLPLPTLARPTRVALEAAHLDFPVEIVESADERGVSLAHANLVDTETGYQALTWHTVHNYPHEPDDVDACVVGDYESAGEAVSALALALVH